jgi:hypothetical protein
MGFFWGVDQDYCTIRWGTIKKTTMVEKRIGQKTGNSAPSVLVPYRNRSGVVDLLGRGPLMFVKVENGVTKLCQKIRRKNRKNAILACFFPLFEQDRLLCARVDIGVTESPTKKAQKEEEKLDI